jgi:hypothetical protein
LDWWVAFLRPLLGMTPDLLEKDDLPSVNALTSIDAIVS